MGKLFVAIDVGCHECGVGSEVIGVYLTEQEAQNACADRSADTDNWRDGGQSVPEVFEIKTPPLKME